MSLRSKPSAQAGLAAAYISFNHRGDGEHGEMIDEPLTGLSALQSEMTELPRKIIVPWFKKISDVPSVPVPYVS
jgi:hypothetical protein